MLGWLRRGRAKHQAPPSSGAWRPRRSRARRLHLAALAAATLYFGGAYVAYELYQSAWYGEQRAAGGAADGGSADANDAESVELSSQERAAMLALAERAQESVFVIETTGTGRGSGFVAWVMQGDSYVITAYRTVAAVLERDNRTVFVRRGSQIRTGQIVREHRGNGLVLIRVGGELAQPLWQQRAEAGTLDSGTPALIVPSGPDTAVGEGFAEEQERGRIPVRARVEPLNLGAPVLGDNGRIAGVVTQTGPGGVNLVVPIEATCEAGIRLCSG